MVIANSDSTNTLVSLDNAIKRVSSLGALQVNNTEEISFRRTNLYLPEDGFCLDDEEETPIYLAQEGYGVSADECLGCLPQIMDARDELLAQNPVNLTRSTTERVLYVGQGEVAHAVTSQCDVIVSDKATTCHILAIRSVSPGAAPLASLTHVDAASYEDCIRSMIQHHKKHHHESTEVRLSVHIVGGFDDSNASSKKISNWLINLLADIAEAERDWLHMTLRDCAISSLNDSGRYSPIGRGLAMNVHTGHVFLAKCDSYIAGPRPTLRAARLWSRATTPELSLIHDERSTCLQIEPFTYSSFEGLNKLLSFPDDLLLHYASTSPDCEEEGFCRSLRSTLTLVRDVPCHRVFGDKPLTFTRVGYSNTWKTTASF